MVMLRKALTTQSVMMVVAISLLAGCDEEVSLDNAGYACLTPDGEVPFGFSGLVFEPDTVLYAHVVLSDCLSSSCDTNRHAECEIAVTGDQIIIESHGGYTDESGAGRSCTDDCEVLETTCQTADPVPEGTYTVVYGDETISFSLGTTAAYCVPPQR